MAGPMSGRDGRGRAHRAARLRFCRGRSACLPAEAISAAPDDVLLAVEGVTKHFSGVTALSDVSLDVRRGEILGLLGENGAGKSTLLKILSGVMPPSSGRILFDGAEFRPANPQDAKRLGIVTIYQELSLIPTLTVAENIFIGRAPIGRLGLVNWRRMEEDSRASSPASG